MSGLACFPVRLSHSFPRYARLQWAEGAAARARTGKSDVRQGGHVLRRTFLTGTAAIGGALATQHTQPAIAQLAQKRLISQIHLWPANTPERPWWLVPGRSYRNR